MLTNPGTLAVLLSMFIFAIWFFGFLARYHFECPCCGAQFSISLIKYFAKGLFLRGKKHATTWNGSVSLNCPKCNKTNHMMPL